MFLRMVDGTIFDFDLQFLREVAQLLDAQLKRLEAEAKKVEDPDGFGVFDSAEHIVGLGFTACQNYLVATYGSLRVRKDKALGVGPKHRGGCTIAALVNHAANFWKHHDEWSLNPNDSRQARTMAGLATVGIEPDGYPLAHLLAALVLPTSDQFQALLSHLEAWRDAVASAA